MKPKPQASARLRACRRGRRVNLNGSALVIAEKVAAGHVRLLQGNTAEGNFPGIGGIDKMAFEEPGGCVERDPHLIACSGQGIAPIEMALTR